MGLRLTVYCGKRGTSTTDKMVDADAVKKICDIYDWDGKGELDLFFLGDIMYAMGYNTTKKVCVGLGQTDEEGKKFAKFDDVVSKVEEALKTPDSQGTYAAYVELLELYEKNQNGTMMLAELDNILCNLGDEIPKEDVQKMFAEICDPEDEDGLFPYMSFLDRLTARPKNPTKLQSQAQKTMAAWNFAEENLTTAITFRCHKTTSETTKTSRSAQPSADLAPQPPSKARRSLEDLH